MAPKFDSDAKEARLKDLADLLLGKSLSRGEILEALPVYTEIADRNFDRDLVTLAERGYTVVAERIYGSRIMSYRIDSAPARKEMVLDTGSGPASRRPPLSELEADPDRWLTTDEAGSYLGISGRRVRYLCDQQDRLPHRRRGEQGKIIEIRARDLLEFAKQNPRKPGRKKKEPPGHE